MGSTHLFCRFLPFMPICAYFIPFVRYSPKECSKIYSFAIPHIFGFNPWRVINPFKAKYSDKAKEELMQHFFAKRKMKDLEKAVAVISFRVDGKLSKVIVIA